MWTQPRLDDLGWQIDHHCLPLPRLADTEATATNGLPSAIATPQVQAIQTGSGQPGSTQVLSSSLAGHHDATHASSSMYQPTATGGALQQASTAGGAGRAGSSYTAAIEATAGFAGVREGNSC